MSRPAPIPDMANRITFISTTHARLAPALIDYVAQLLTTQEDQTLNRYWHLIFTRPHQERQQAILQAFGYSQLDEDFMAQFDTFIQSLLSAVQNQDPETATVLANALRTSNSNTTSAPPVLMTRLDLLLVNDAQIDANRRPKRNDQVEQSVVDMYGLPARSLTGREGQDYWYHNTEELKEKLRCMKQLYGGDIVRWNERDWRAGLYGNPNDWSESGTNTGWVVQRRARPDPRLRKSRGRLPGSLGAAMHSDHQDVENQDLSPSRELTSSANERTPTNLTSASGPSASEHSIQTEPNLFLDDTDDFFQTINLTMDEHAQAQNFPKHDDGSSLSAPSQILSSPARPTQTTHPVQLANTGQLSDSDRKLIEEYRRSFEAKEEQIRAARRQKAAERRLIRTSSEEDLMRAQSPG